MFLQTIKTYLLSYLNTQIQDATNPDDAGKLARLIAYININL